MKPNLNKKPDIIIVDDHLIFRQGLKAIINFENVGSVIGEVSNGEELIQLLSTMKPDLVLMDIDMPGMNGFEATKKALEIMPDLKIIAFTVFSEEVYYQKMKDLGARGFILKSSGFNELENAIKIVMTGEIYFTKRITKATNQETDQIEISKKDDRSGMKEEMLFFPWVVNDKNCINIEN